MLEKPVEHDSSHSHRFRALRTCPRRFNPYHHGAPHAHPIKALGHGSTSVLHRASPRTRAWVGQATFKPIAPLDAAHVGRAQPRQHAQSHHEGHCPSVAGERVRGELRRRACGARVAGGALRFDRAFFAPRSPTAEPSSRRPHPAGELETGLFSSSASAPSRPPSRRSSSAPSPARPMAGSSGSIRGQGRSPPRTRCSIACARQWRLPGPRRARGWRARGAGQPGRGHGACPLWHRAGRGAERGQRGRHLAHAGLRAPPCHPRRLRRPGGALASRAPRAGHLEPGRGRRAHSRATHAARSSPFARGAKR